MKLRLAIIGFATVFALVLSLHFPSNAFADGGVYGGNDSCYDQEFGCTTGTNPLGLFLGFLAFLVISVIFISIKESISDSSFKRRKRKREREQSEKEESDRKYLENYNAEMKKKGLLTDDELQSIIDKINNDIQKSSRKKSVKKKAAKKRVVRNKEAKKKKVKRKTTKRK